MPTIPVIEFLGPLGGLICIAWGMGAIAGYVFHSKTVLKMHETLCEAKIKALEEQNRKLENRVLELETRYQAHGLGRVKFLDNNQIIDVTGGKDEL